MCRIRYMIRIESISEQDWHSFNITTKLYDKRDTFGFHIVNFPFMSSNIPSAPAYGVYASQLITNKRDTFGFHIVNFPFMSSNIPSAPAYGVYASQLIRYARCCSNYCDFLSRHRALVTRLLSQGYKVNHLSNTFKKFHGRHTDLVGQYKKMSAKCLLILSVVMVFIFDGFANAQINKIC